MCDLDGQNPSALPPANMTMPSHLQTTTGMCDLDGQNPSALPPARGAYYWSDAFAKQHIDDRILHCL